MAQKSPQIKVTNVRKEYKLADVNVKALDGINLEIFEGEFISIVGKSGSGKSTLMHIIGLLDRPTSGTVFHLGNDISKMSDNALAALRGDKIGFVFQSFNLLSRTSSLDNVLLPTTYSKHRRSDNEVRALALLKRVGMENRVKNLSNQLSGGQQQRVAIARALINEPEIILADEPTGNLDSKSGDEILKLLENLHDEGKTVIIVTHDDSIAAVTDRCIRIIDGKVVEDIRR